MLLITVGAASKYWNSCASIINYLSATLVLQLPQEAQQVASRCLVYARLCL